MNVETLCGDGDLAKAATLRRILVPHEGDLPYVTAFALAAGHDSPSLRALAGASSRTLGGELDELFQAALDEMYEESEPPPQKHIDALVREAASRPIDA